MTTTPASPVRARAPRSSRRGLLLTVLYWALVSAVAVYVAIATPYRFEYLTTDAWEHHRAIRALAEHGWHPGNPTYDTPDASVRYSPYTAALAIIVKQTGLSARDVQSGAAVANFLLLAAGLWVFLRVYGRQFLALPALIGLLCIYGRPPNYASSVALEDLPWHGVNPSSASLWVCLFLFALWRWAADARARLFIAFPVCAVGLAAVFLSHGITGVMGGIGLASIAVGLPTMKQRIAHLGTTVALGVAMVLLASQWPLFDFVAMLRGNDDDWYWWSTNAFILMVTVWALPALILSLLALPLRRQELVRVALWATLGFWSLALVSGLVKSHTFTRLPLAGVVFSQILIAIAAWRLGLLSLQGWRTLATRLRSKQPEQFALAGAACAIVGAVLLFGVPQALALVRDTHLLREPLLLGRVDRQKRYWDRYQALLEGVGQRDVFIGHKAAVWPVPSFAGRVVAAEHLEFFTPDQRKRQQESAEFLAPSTTDVRRIEILRAYNVRWILLRSDNLAESMLIEESAVHRREDRPDGLVLLRAEDWISARARSMNTAAE